MWAVINPDGSVVLDARATPSNQEIREVFGGYRPIEITLDDELGVRAWISSVDQPEVNFPAAAILAGHTIGFRPVKGTVILVEPNGNDLPEPVMARVMTLLERKAGAA